MESSAFFISSLGKLQNILIFATCAHVLRCAVCVRVCVCVCARARARACVFDCLHAPQGCIVFLSLLGMVATCYACSGAAGRNDHRPFGRGTYCYGGYYMDPYCCMCQGPGPQACESIL